MVTRTLFLSLPIKITFDTHQCQRFLCCSFTVSYRTTPHHPPSLHNRQRHSGLESHDTHVRPTSRRQLFDVLNDEACLLSDDVLKSDTSVDTCSSNWEYL